MELNDIDDTLQDLGMNNPSPTPPSPQQENESSVFSNEDVDDILQENGFTTAEPSEEDNNGEGREEEEENTAYLESQSEGNDLTVDQDGQEELAEARQSFQEALDDYEEDGEEEDEEPVESSSSNPEEKVLIPQNSPTLLMNESTTRFSGAEWFKEIQKTRIIVGGCGGIGSNLIFQLARMTPANITVYDDDVVEMVNMAGQLFSYSDIGKTKVDAIAGMVMNYTSMRQILAIRQKFTATTEAGNIMMSGFDNMSARKTFFYTWKEHISKKSMEDRKKCLLLDGRLSIDTLQIFCIRGDDTYNIDRYQREFLFHDYQAEQTVCSMKQTTYLACMIGSLMVNLFTNFVAGQLDPILPYDLPFFTEYDAQNMLFKTES